MESRYETKEGVWIMSREEELLLKNSKEDLVKMIIEERQHRQVERQLQRDAIYVILNNLHESMQKLRDL